MISFDHGSTEQHQALGREFAKAIPKSFSDVVILPYTVGMFRDWDSAERVIHAGQVGAPDWIVLGCGWYLFFDAKTGQAKFSPEQKAFKARIDAINKGTEHVYKLTSVVQGLDTIKRAKEFYEKRFTQIT